MKKLIKKALVFVLSAAVAAVSCAVVPATGAKAAEPIVVVIDPGHGGSNLGTDYLPIPEKVYTMVVAQHMKERLEQYQNVQVYLTHTEDVDMSLKERAEFAASVNADFLYSLHFNMSLSHILYGSEVWVPSSGQLYSQGYSAANEFLMQFEEMGLFNRGIKTRIGSSGKSDYYGIIRESAVRGIPALIVEHCHVDHSNDASYIQSSEKLKEFGVRDAEAVARYFGLVSKDGKTDYSGYAPLAVPVPENRVCNDTTAPYYVSANLLKYDQTGKYATVELTALDDESVIQHYAYSCDNGLTWSMLQPWTKGSPTMTVTVNMGYGRKDSLIFKAYNLYDASTESNVIRLN
ncbi:MAG: N-acetylmuramoyl-L-alanine amidase [Lachnospiraceae bacterium]|nr:N-acetylmuramoyl-L-alanine amidase [Lachnospiraceae bacterium]MDE7031409.1 N-acetylmuramoyl-L-alanine amidase [Lachnospiraceae bacterium]